MKIVRNKIMIGVDADHTLFSTVEKIRRRLNSYREWGVVLLVALLFPITVSAAPVQITNISGLQINTATYNVAFAYGSFNTLFDIDDDRVFGEADGSAFNHAPTFWGNQNGAMTAAQAIIAQLGTNSYLSNYFGTLVDSFFVPYADSFGSIMLYQDNDSTMTVDVLQLNWYSDNAWSGLNPIAVFTKISTVPIPAAEWLFASGLLSLTASARRKK